MTNSKSSRAQHYDAFVAVGSNVDPERNILAALALLSERTRIVGVSPFYRTQPIVRSEQEEFRNGVFRIETTFSPRTLKFEVLRPVEAALGRVRTNDPYAARTIDLDLVFYEDTVIDEVDLRIPDRDLRDRAFVAAAVLDLAPELCLPDTGERLAEAYERRHASEHLIVDEDLTRRLRERVSG